MHSYSLLFRDLLCFRSCVLLAAEALCVPPPPAGPYPPYRQKDSKVWPMEVLASTVVLNSVC